MRWLAATILLLAATAAFSGVIYARDLVPGAWHPPAGGLAAADARAVYRLLTGGHCHGRCGVSDVRRIAGARWSATLRLGATVRCADIDVDTFGHDGRAGVRGASVEVCPGSGESVRMAHTCANCRK